jgi:exosortase
MQNRLPPMGSGSAFAPLLLGLNPKYGSMKKTTAAALIALAVSFVLAYQDVLFWLMDDWDLDEEYSHGWLVVPIALYLAWERREQLARAPLRPSRWGLVLLVFSLGALAAGTLAAETFVARISIVLTAVAAVLYVTGVEHVRILRFPLAFLLLMIPIPGIIFNRIVFPLQLVASDFGARSLAAAGIPVFREGNLISLAHMNLDVAEACSGIRSLISLFTLSLLYGYFTEPRLVMRVILLIATIPVAIFANGVRVAATGVAANFYGAKVAEGFFHSFSGWIVFLVAGVTLLGIHRSVNLVMRRHPPAVAARVTEDCA